MLTPQGRSGFTLVEVVVALLLLTFAVLGLGASVNGLVTSAASAELSALAVEAADDRLVEIRMDPRYDAIDTLYSGTESDLLMEGATRTTTVTHVLTTNPVLNYKRITVTVRIPHMIDPVTRQIVVAAP